MKNFAAVTGQRRAGRGVSAGRKKHCRRCRTRVSRSAKKCGYCGKRLPSRSRLVAFAFAGVVVLFFLARFLVFS